MVYQSIKLLPIKHLPKILGIAAAFASALVVQSVQAQTRTHEGWYQVEMIVVARKDDAGQEHWPSNIKLRYPGDWVELKDPTAAEANTADSNAPSAVDLTKEAFYLLPASERQLNVQAQKLQRSARFEVLFHNAWRQVITNKKSSKAIIINGGQTFGQHQALEGSIRLSVATYLELQTNLWLAQFDVNVGQEITQPWPEIPVRPNLTTTAISNLSLDSDVELEQALANENTQWSNGSFDANTNAAAPENDNFVTRQIILLQQERDMRSNEVHYIDHPALNVIIQVTPYPPVATAPAPTAQ
ncbi:MAG: CsiV family protein [Cellvibrio sp.]|uniref:CsiV family protein n=1 Tax=Cellvibrio sp. TaxID=1965322 RepID=UPI00271C56D7|nr:CsiV family protein [Cellvibrio sp.]